MPSRAGSQTEDMYDAQYSEDGFLVYDNRKSFEEPVQGILLSDSFLMAKEDSEWIVYASQVITFSRVDHGPGICRGDQAWGVYVQSFRQ